jgi:hypothetical protein
MQAVVIAGFVAEHQRGRQRLLFTTAPLQEFGEPGRESLTLIQPFGPSVCDFGKRTIELLAKFPHQRRQRVGEILILAPPEVVTSHHDAAAEGALVGIEPHELIAILFREQRPGQRISSLVELGGEYVPVRAVKSLCRSFHGIAFVKRTHAIS